MLLTRYINLERLKFNNQVILLIGDEIVSIVKKFNAFVKLLALQFFKQVKLKM